jgi:hypothetical protein
VIFVGFVVDDLRELRGWFSTQHPAPSTQHHIAVLASRMRITRLSVFGLVFATGLLVGITFTSVGGAQRQAPASAACGASGMPQVRTTLYFGMARPKGSVGELEWQVFLKDEVTRGFPTA